MAGETTGTVELATLVGRAAEESYLSLKELVEKSINTEGQSDSEKKIGILKFLVKTQQRMLRLNVLSKWCQQVGSLVKMARETTETVELAALVGRATEESYLSLKKLVEKSTTTEGQSDSKKKIGILKFLVKTQQRMLRLDVLSK